MKKYILITVAALLSATAMAQTQYDPALQQQRHADRLAQKKATVSASHQARIAILQTADNCVKAATTPTAYRACEEQERNARQAHRAQQKAMRDLRRAEHEQREAMRMARTQQ